MQNFIFIILILIWSGLLFVGGFFVGCKYLQQSKRSHASNKNFWADKRLTEKELTPEQQREAERLKKQMQNFFTYNGEEQEEIIV